MKRSTIAILVALAMILMPGVFSAGALAADGYGWFFQTSGTTEDLQGVCAVSETVAWAVGWNDTILKTVDGGTWGPQASGTAGQDLSCIDAVDANNAWIVGGGSTVLKTTNGTAWTPPPTPLPGGTVYLQGVSVLDANTAWIAGNTGKIFKTTDGGTSWDTQVSGTTGDLFDIEAVDVNTAWVVGNDGVLLKTTNGGALWTPQNPGTNQKLRGIDAVDTQTAIAVGFSGTVTKTVDGGATWVPQNAPVEDIVADVTMVDGNLAWAVGYIDLQLLSGHIIKTLDGGTNWYGQSVPPVGDLYSVSAASKSVAWAVGTSGAILKTIDGGESLSTWYLAEGSTDWGYNCYITIENPEPTLATIRMTYMTKNGPQFKADFQMAAQSQVVANPRDDIGITDFSTKVECLELHPIAVDRTMIWTGQSAASPEAHCSIGVTAPVTTWFLPEGSSAWGFECWLLIQNPNVATANCTVTYMIQGEGPRDFTKTVPANSRSTFNMSDDIGPKDASIKVTSDIPVIPERAMYRDSRREGHDSVGTTKAANDFFLAEGATAYGFTTWVLVQNPNAEAVDVTIHYMTPEGETVQPTFSMQPGTRQSINVNDILPGKDVSTMVHGSKPIIAERAMYWPGGLDSTEACHDSIGMAAAHRSFYLPDGQTVESCETWTLIQNPYPTPVEVEMRYFTPTGQGNVTKTETIQPNSRRSFSMFQHSGISGRAAIMVRCITPDTNIMVERAMYWNNRGAGTDTIGGYSD